MLEGVWEGRRSHTHILGMSENIYILARGNGWDYENPFTPLFFLLEGIPQDLCSKNQRYILHILLLSARKTIINWMKPHPPTMAQWIEKVESIYRMEYWPNSKWNNFIQRWTPVTMCLDALKMNWSVRNLDLFPVVLFDNVVCVFLFFLLICIIISFSLSRCCCQGKFGSLFVICFNV